MNKAAAADDNGVKNRPVNFSVDIRRKMMLLFPPMPRWLEAALAVFFLILTAPLWVFLIVWIKLDSKGPAFFRQLRVGKDGRLFWLWKFRGMVENGTNGHHHHSNVSGKDDPRVSRAGRFLRATKMDELPQLINILKGEMSFVGPRPEVPEMIEKYPLRALEVLTFKPGLTCPGTLTYVLQMEQFLPPNGEAEGFYLRNIVEKKARLDLMYLQKENVVEDLRLIFVSTPWAILKRAGGRLMPNGKTPPLFSEEPLPQIKEKVSI
jgi:lipopolysaccharide/colanic/teichoic acid biosynthesis glycosyltransferase